MTASSFLDIALGAALVWFLVRAWANRHPTKMISRELSSVDVATFERKRKAK